MPVPKLTRRTLCYSWCHGQFYQNSPSDGNITLVTTHRRNSDAYVLHVDGQSGVSSTYGPPAELSQTRRFTRLYFWFVSIPSSSRIFWSANSSSPSGAGNINFRMKSDGHVEVRSATTVLATSSSAFTTGRWYRFEVGHDTGAQIISLRVDGNTEIDWVATTVSNCFTGQGIGAMDTVAAAFEYYATDYSCDNVDFPGYGLTGINLCASLAQDSANWVNTGGASDKMAAVNPNIGGSYDDTTYILGNTNGSEIAFTMDNFDSSVKVVYGLTMHRRYIRNGGTNSAASTSIGYTDQSVYISSSSASIDQLSSTSSRKTDQSTTATAISVLGPWWPTEFYGTFAIGLVCRDSNGIQVSAFWAEFDYTDIGGELQPGWPITLCDFESATTDVEYVDTNTTAAGATDTAQAKFGSRSCKLTHPSGGRQNMRATLGTYFDEFSSSFSPKMYTMSFWVYVDTRQSSGNMGLAFWQDNTTVRFRLYVNASGGLIADIAGSQSSATANDTVPSATWVHIGVEIYTAPSSGTNSRMKVYVNDVLKITHTGTQSTTKMGATFFHGLGSDINVTGGATVYYDGWICDMVLRHDSQLKFATLTPNAAGSSTVTGFTANGAVNKWDCVDELPDDGDTTYVLLAAGLGTTSHESWAFASIASAALRLVNLIIHTAVHKRDGATNGNWGHGELIVRNSNTIINRTANVASGSTYGYRNRRLRTNLPLGMHTPAIINDLESDALQQSNVNATRITEVALTVGYFVNNAYAANPRRPIMAIG